MKVTLVNIIIILILTAFNLNNSYSQEIKVNINVNMEQVSFENRASLNNFKSDLERYINSQRFLDKEWEGDPIPVEMNIILSSDGKNRFSAKMLMASKRLLDGPEDVLGFSTTISFYEKEWKFVYNNGANLSLDQMRYDEFSTLINYYMYLIIGFDLDTYQSNGGNKAFEKARNLALVAANAGDPGFDNKKDASIFNKYNYVNEILDIRISEIRRLIFAYYINGLDKIAFNKDSALDEIANIINDMANYKKNKLMNQNHLFTEFFNTKFEEIASLFNNYKNPDFFNNLKYLDPANSASYSKSEAGTYLK